MSDIQRIIKYLAIAFAIYLVVIIVGGIITFLGSMLFIFGNDNGITETMEPLAIDSKHEVKEIEIDIKGASLVIEEGEKLSVETNNSYIETNQSGNKLTIKEKGHRWFKNNSESKLHIYIPSSLDLDKFSIDTGAGKLDIASIKAEEVKLSLGAGQAIIKNIEATKKSKISGGAGEMIIKDGILYNLDFDMGVGRTEITSAILGNSDIEAGVGELEINILGKEENYELDVEKGIGRIEVNGNVLNNDSKYGQGTNKIDIDGGVGKISISFRSNTQIKDEIKEELEKVTFTKTYKVLNKTPYNEEDSFYLTLQVLEGEVDTVVVKKIKESIIEGKTYEFTFEKDNSKIVEDNLESIFNNCKLLEIKETNKLGPDQIQDKIN